MHLPSEPESRSASAAGPLAVSRPMAYMTLGLLFGMNMLNYIDRYVLYAVQPLIMAPAKPVPIWLPMPAAGGSAGPSLVMLPVSLRGLGLTGAQMGWVTSAFLISYSLIMPLMGWAGDRFTRKYLLALGVGIWSLATAGGGLATGFVSLMLARSIMGIGEATYGTIAPTMISDVFPTRQRSRALAVFYLAISVGSALGYVLGGLIGSHSGWRSAFFIVGLPGVVIALASLALPEPVRGASEDVSATELARYAAEPIPLRAYGNLARIPSYVLNTLGMAMMTFALGGLSSWMPTYLNSVMQMDLTRATSILGIVSAVAGLVGTILGAWIAEPLAARVKGAYFLLSGIGVLVAAPIAAVALLAHWLPLVFAMVFIALLLLFLNTGPTNAVIVNVVEPRLRSTAFAINIFVLHLLGDIPSNPAIGAVRDATHDLRKAMLMVVPVLVLSGLFFLAGAPWLGRDQAAAVDAVRRAPPRAAEPARIEDRG